MQNKKAISLIVLVITIIVMIILASAIIMSLNNTNIFKKAEQAVDKANEAQVKQIAQLGWAETYADGARTVEELTEGVKKALTDNKINPDDYIITVTTKGVEIYKVTIPEEWSSSVVDIVDTVPIPKGFIASSAKGENTKAKGLVIYEGTEAVTDDNVETARRSRNQYVWVPVDSATFDTTFVRKDYINSTSQLSDTLGTSGFWEVLPTTELTTDNLKFMTEETLTEVQAMYTSVKKYGGFYIARYEAGIDTQRTTKGEAANLPGIKEGTEVYSVMGKIPYTFIPWTWNNAMNEDTNGAVEVARNIYPKDKTNITGVVSTLTYGVQWDTTLQWFIDTGAMTKKQVNQAEGSTEYGNYSNHVINTSSELNDGALVLDYSASSSGSYVAKDSETLTYPKTYGIKWVLSTGALKVANVNNIYDMAGNVYEWTVEGHSIGGRAIRGGCFDNTGVVHPVAYRYYNSLYNAYISSGFRPSLYIK